MYNLTVATAHTYFVGEGPWLVHNASCSVKGARVQANRQQGDLFRDQIAKEFENAGYGVKTEVVKETGFGPRRIDIEVSSPEGKILGGIETKTGSSRYTSSQRAKDEWLRMFKGYWVNVVRDR